jgi:hypothetical protein
MVAASTDRLLDSAAAAKVKTHLHRYVDIDAPAGLECGKERAGSRRTPPAVEARRVPLGRARDFPHIYWTNFLMSSGTNGAKESTEL